MEKSDVKVYKRYSWYYMAWGLPGKGGKELMSSDCTFSTEKECLIDAERFQTHFHGAVLTIACFEHV